MSSFWNRLRTLGSRPSLPSQERVSFQQDDSDWKAVFEDASLLINGPKQIEEAQARMMSRLLRVYQTFERLSRQQAAFLQGVIRAVDYCDGLEPRLAEINAVRDLLLGVLSDQGVIPWSPTIGERIPEGCEPIAEEFSADHPPQTVLKVPTPGYLWKDGTILRRPRIIVSMLPPTEIPQVDSPSQTPINPEATAEGNK
jgi:hypothetical protein